MYIHYVGSAKLLTSSCGDNGLPGAVSREAKAIVSELRYKMDINTLRKNEEVSSLTLNEIGRVKLHTASPLFYDSYDKNRHTGSFILIDPGTNETVAAGMIL